MTEEPKTFSLDEAQRAEAQAAGEMIMDISHTLGSAQRDRSGMTEYAYREQRIAVIHAERFDTLTVSVRIEEHMTTVYYAHRKRPEDPDIFRPGTWTRYMNLLATRAMLKRAERERERAIARARDYEHTFAPVDDAAVFRDLTSPGEQE